MHLGLDNLISDIKFLLLLTLGVFFTQGVREF